MSGLTGPGGVQTAALWSAVLCLAAVAARLLHAREQAARRAGLLLADGACILSPGLDQPWRRYAARARSAAGRAGSRLAARTGLRFGHEALCAPAGLVLAWCTGSPLPALAGLAAVPVLGAAMRARARRRYAEQWEEAVAAFCAEVAGELRAGRVADAALAQAAERLRMADGAPAAAAGLRGRAESAAANAQAVTRLVAATRFGGDVPQALRLAARRPGTRGLAGVAACWETAVDHGAGLADGLDRVADALRAERDQRADLRAQLAGPRSTAAMLALLPLFGIVLGSALGADPLRVLLHTPAGLGCLLAGGVLEGAGLAWTHRIVRAAEEA